MYMQRIGVLSLLVVVAGCEQTRGACHNETCTTEQRCDETTYHCVDDLRPVLSLAPLTEVITAATFTLTGYVKDDLALTNAEWRAGDRAWTSIEGVDVDGGFTLTIDAPLLDAELIAVSARANDVHGEVTASTQVKVDRVGPSLLLKVPAENSVQGADSFQVDVIPHDGSGSIASFILHGAPVANPVNDGRVSTTVSVPANANHVAIPVLATATDARGNATTKTFTFIGDRVAPEVTFASPALNQFITTATFTVEVVVAEPGALQGVVFHVGTTDVPGVMGANGHWTASLPAGEVEQDAIITVTATDDGGNVGSASRTVRIDRVVPTVTINAPSSGTAFRTAVLLSVQTSSGTSAVTASLEGQVAMLTGGPSTWSGTLAVGAHDYAAVPLTVRAVDLAGNEGTATMTIGVDTIAPVITFTAPGSMQKFRALDFSATPEVTSTWTVVDGDTQAATTTVNGAASTALTFARATAATDNPTTYTTTVTAADRAGNTATAARSYSVDRVAPQVTAWAPLANARNVFPRRTELSFSEPVTGGVGVTVVGQAQPTGSWNSTSVFSLPLDAFAARVVDLQLNTALTDLHGNPLSNPAVTRKAHLATGFPSGSLITIATNVREFDVSTDADGVATIAVMSTGTTWSLLTDTGGAFTPVTTPLPTTIAEAAVNSWNVVNATTLASSQRRGVSVRNGSTYSRWWSVDGVVSNDSQSLPSTIVSMPPIGNEDASGAVGGIIGTTYTRTRSPRPPDTNTLYSYDLPFQASLKVLQANSDWVTFGSTATSIRWTRWACALSGTPPFQLPSCAATEYGAMTASPTKMQSAITRSGSCLAVTWESGGARYAAFQGQPMCGLSCTNNTSYAFTGTSPDMRVGTFDGRGEDTLIGSYRAGSNLVLSKMDLGICGGFGSTLGTFLVPGAKAHAPLRVGNSPALLYIDASDVLKLQVP